MPEWLLHLISGIIITRKVLASFLLPLAYVKKLLFLFKCTLLPSKIQIFPTAGVHAIFPISNLTEKLILEVLFFPLPQCYKERLIPWQQILTEDTGPMYFCFSNYVIDPK